MNARAMGDYGVRAGRGCIALLAMALAGCAGAQTTVAARNANVPVSLSRAVRDENGVIVGSERRKVVGEFREERTAWNILWSLVRLTPETDLSESINRQVAAAHGDAVTHLSVETGHCPLNSLLFPFGALPFWPSCASVTVKGEIIQVSDGSIANPANETRGVLREIAKGDVQ